MNNQTILITSSRGNYFLDRALLRSGGILQGGASKHAEELERLEKISSEDCVPHLCCKVDKALADGIAKRILRSFPQKNFTDLNERIYRADVGRPLTREGPMNGVSVLQ